MTDERVRRGRVEVICGPMFAGKSEELLRRVRRARIAGLRVEVVGHTLDTRVSGATVGSHSGLRVPAVALTTAPEVAEHARALLAGPGLDVLAVDEVQFFGDPIVDVLQRIADAGVVVLAAGLDVTFDARPFEPTARLMALAERVDKLTAVCAVCGEDAAFHVRLPAPARPAATRPAPAARLGDATVPMRLGDATVPMRLGDATVPMRLGDATVPIAAHIGGAEAYAARCRRHLDAAAWR